MAPAKRRGRPAGKGRTQITGVRLPVELRAALEKAAGENYRSLSAEIEARLRSTLPATKRSPR